MGTCKFNKKLTEEIESTLKDIMDMYEVDRNKAMDLLAYALGRESVWEKIDLVCESTLPDKKIPYMRPLFEGQK